jgi:iron complex outermembrane receptor protein
LLKENTHNPATGAANPDPQQQVMLRSSYDFNKHLSLDAQLRYVDQILGASSYVTADVRVAYRPTKNLELSLVGQNLFAEQHLEQGPIPLVTQAEVPRGFYGKITWHF